MKTANQILSDCFLGVIDFNEAAAVDAMEKYAKQESAECLKALIELKKWVSKLDDWKGIDPPTEIVDKVIKNANHKIKSD